MQQKNKLKKYSGSSLENLKVLAYSLRPELEGRVVEEIRVNWTTLILTIQPLRIKNCNWRRVHIPVCFSNMRQEATSLEIIGEKLELDSHSSKTNLEAVSDRQDVEKNCSLEESAICKDPFA